jgi:hypothetical protein
VITHPAHSSHTIKCARKDLKPNQRNVVDVVLWDASVVAKKPILISNGSHFMAMINPPEEKAKALPANNTKLKKEGKFKRWWRHLWKKG